MPFDLGESWDVVQVVRELVAGVRELEARVRKLEEGNQRISECRSCGIGANQRKKGLATEVAATVAKSAFAD